PRGGMIVANDEEIGKKINSAVFPGLQGGPLMHVIAAKAVALGEALRPEYNAYIRAVVDNAKMLADTLTERGCAIVSGGTDSHVMSVDLRRRKSRGASPKYRWNGPASPATRTASRSTRKSRRSHRASGSAARRRRRAASARLSSARPAI